MTSTNFTIDNINPLIQYTPAALWTEGSAANDPLASQYSNGGTFTLCTTKGSSASFTFNGTQVFVHGAKRPNHGPYSVTLDGATTLFDGFSENPIFGTLFVSPVLTLGQHTVSVTNQLTDTNLPFLDIDFITWTSTVPNDGETTTIEDTDASFSYSPTTSWNTDLSSVPLTGFGENNGHFTQTAGATTTVSFTGGVISIFGPVGPNISPYTVAIDGVSAGTFNATKKNYAAQVALYSATRIGDGKHTIELTAQPAVAGQYFAVDFAQILPVASVSATPTSSGASSASGKSKSPGSKSSIGAAVGGAIAGIFVLAIFILLLFLLRRRKRRNAALSKEDVFVQPAPAPSNPTQPESQTHLVSVPGSSYQLSSVASPRSPPLASPWSPVHQPMPSNQRMFRTVNGPDNESAAGSSDTDGRSVYAPSTVLTSGFAGLGASAPRKGVPLPLPPTANVPLPAGASRMNVQGREQDYGPLPPDYEQATEPYGGM